MVDYVVAKENTGVYHDRRSVHMPVDVELQQRNTERLVLTVSLHLVALTSLMSAPALKHLTTPPTWETS